MRANVPDVMLEGPQGKGNTYLTFPGVFVRFQMTTQEQKETSFEQENKYILNPAVLFYSVAHLILCFCSNFSSMFYPLMF